MTSTTTGQAVAPAANPTASPLRAYLALGLGVFVISFNPILVKFANTDGDVAGAYRLGVAGLALSVAVFYNWRKGRVRLSRGSALMGVLAGIALAVDLWGWNTAILLIGPGMATLLGNTAPLWVAMGAWLLFRERLRPLYWVGLAVALTGTVLIVGLDALQGLSRGIGNLLALSTGLAYAIYQLITHRALARVDTLTFMWIYSGVGGLVLLGVSLALGHPLTGLPTGSTVALIGMALFSHIGGWILLNYAFGHLPVSQVSVTLLGQPVLATLMAALLFHQIPEIWQVAGGIVTLAGIYLVHRSSTQTAPEPVPV